ncbi:MAG: DUF5668 domain-containing protein [Patescibacteria group bacterium]|jgi:hypothetical protein
MFMPWLLIVVGLIFLLENLNLLPWLNWSVIWPVILILIGLNMMRKKSGDGCCGWPGGKKEEEKK